MATLIQRLRSILGLDSGPGDQKTEAEEESGSIWDFTPDWQRYGRFEGAGITRGEQEQAIKDIQEQVDEAEKGIQEHDGQS